MNDTFLLENYVPDFLRHEALSHLSRGLVQMEVPVEH